MTDSPHAAHETAADHLRLSVEGMHCAGCVGNVEKALRSVEGVTSASVSLAHASAEVAGAGQIGRAHV